jgi:molybdenum cofactor cytidylyltransferase
MEHAQEDGMIEGQTDCIMLAAGESARMKDWKMMLPFRGSTILEKSIETALTAARRVILVSGYRGDEIKKRFASYERVIVIENTRYSAGMFSSIKIGTAEVRSKRFFIALGDMPLVESSIYRTLLEYTCAPVVIPKFRGKKGHPVLLSHEVAERILTAPETETLRDILASFATLAVPVQSACILKDIDTTVDYERLSGNNLDAERYAPGCRHIKKSEAIENQ